MLGWLLLLGLLAYATSRIFLGYPEPEAAMRRLAAREAAFLAAAADTLFPEGGAVSPSGRQAGIPGYVDGYLDAVPPRTRLLMRLLFFLVEHATLLRPAPRPGGFRRFSSLSPTQRERVLEAWDRSSFFPFRLVFTSLRAVLSMGYFADPAVLRRLGLAPYAIESPVCEADLLYPGIGASGSSIRPRSLTPPASPTPQPLDLDGPLHPDYAAPPS